MALFNKEHEHGVMISVLDFEHDEELREIYNYPINVKGGYAPGGVPVFIKKLDENEDTFLLKIDTFNNGSYENLEPMEIKEGKDIRFLVKRTWENGIERLLPYRIIYRQIITQDGDIKRLFYWVPGYVAEGGIQYNDDELSVRVYDLNGDGIIDERDFRRGSTISIDLNRDGTHGRGEHFFYFQYFPIFETYYILDTLYTDMTHIRFRKVDIQIPRVGEKTPQFTFITTNDEIISSDDLQGRNYILNFWASWCIPCISKFPPLKELEKKYSETLEVFAVNVDYQNRLSKAQKVIEEYNLTWPQVMTGKGDLDTLFRLFTTMDYVHPVIPLYIFINENGVIKYAGNSFEQLENTVSKMNFY